MRIDHVRFNIINCSNFIPPPVWVPAVMKNLHPQIQIPNAGTVITMGKMGDPCPKINATFCLLRKLEMTVLHKNLFH